MRVLLNYLGVELSSGNLAFFERYQRRPALGLLGLESVLRAAGHDVELWDQRVEPMPAERWVERVRAGGFDLVGLQVFSTTRDHHAWYLRRLRRGYDGLIAVGGADAVKDRFWLEAGADLAVIGEGERTLVEVLDRHARDEPLAGLAGVSVRGADGEIVRGPDRGYLTVAELEALPYPAWTAERTRQFFDALVPTYRLPAASLMTARGCPYKCSFCASPSIWTSVRQRSVGHVLAEIDWLVERFGVRYLFVQDDIFGLKTDWVLELSAELERRRYPLGWMCILHPLAFGERRGEAYRAMAAAGLDFVSLGAQSADGEVLKGIHRSAREPAILRKNVALCRELGIATVLTYIFGLPGDTPTTVEQAIDFTRDVGPTLADFHPLGYIAGSELERQHPDEDANPFPFSDHVRWAARARRRFYLSAATAWRLLAFIAARNPRFLWDLTRMSWDALRLYLLDTTDRIEWAETGRGTRREVERASTLAA